MMLFNRFQIVSCKLNSINKVESLLRTKSKNSPFFRSSSWRRSYSSDSFKTPEESKRVKILPFSTDKVLRGKYLNPFGGIRFGMVLEELDIVAGGVAYAHAMTPLQMKEFQNAFVSPVASSDVTRFELPITIVTASCNRIELLNPLQDDKDLRFEGMVSYVGRSSMEIKIVAYTCISETEREPAVEAHFIMVARGMDSKAVPVIRLQPVTEKEKRHFKEGEDHARRRKLASDFSITKKPPNDEERLHLHQLYLSTHFHTSEQLVLMSTTRFENTHLMQPQERNIHNKIFGGFLMRQAFELAWTTCYWFACKQPTLKAIDDIAFLEPVEIGQVVTFSSKVVYSTENAVEVSVAADVIDPKSNARKTTNVFQFTFLCPDLKKKVIPFSYEDCLNYITGRRNVLKIPWETMEW